MNKTATTAVAFANFAIEHGIKNVYSLAKLVDLRTRISKAICRNNSDDEPKIEEMVEKFKEDAKELGFSKVEQDCHFLSLYWPYEHGERIVHHLPSFDN